MSSRKQLKKEINDTLGALIEEVYVKELSAPELDSKKSDKIIDEAISLFDDLNPKNAPGTRREIEAAFYWNPQFFAGERCSTFCQNRKVIGF